GIDNGGWETVVGSAIYNNTAEQHRAAVGQAKQRQSVPCRKPVGHSQRTTERGPVACTMGVPDVSIRVVDLVTIIGPHIFMSPAGSHPSQGVMGISTIIIAAHLEPIF